LHSTSQCNLLENFSKKNVVKLWGLKMMQKHVAPTFISPEKACALDYLCYN
jgi:hypothetical protein